MLAFDLCALCALREPTGSNQYSVPGHGNQDVVKGVRFLRFPDVLQLQLKRFDYDGVHDRMVKIGASVFRHFFFFLPLSSKFSHSVNS
jgi:hypothetical protein